VHPEAKKRRGIGRPGTWLKAQLERDGWHLLASLESLSGTTRATHGGELLRKLNKEPADSPGCGRSKNHTQ
jgi:hypothetical protein